MNKRDEFLKEQKILRLATVGKNKDPHIVPVWYRYSGKKFYIGTNTKTVKAKNVRKNSQVSCCVDVGINAPNIYGVLVKGNANLILKRDKVKKIAKKILLRYFESLDSKSARTLLDDTDCIMEIIPEKFTVWDY
jgi:general stress protein 26